MIRPFLIWTFVILFFSSCQKDLEVPMQDDKPYILEIPAGFPAPLIPEGKELTVMKVELGKQLFFDKRLSADNTISCGSCHMPDKAFADNEKLGLGIKSRLGNRNVPSLANIAFHPYFLKDGGATSLEAQILVPLEDHNEMDFSLEEVVRRLEGDPKYEELSIRGFKRKFDAFVLVNAIAAFERILISGNSKYDKFKEEKVSFTLSEMNGLQIFNENCASCHSGFDLSNYSFQNNGLYENYMDNGRARITLDHNDEGKFKVPTLRNIALTFPYMHDGSLKTLEEVIAHYNNGGSSHSNKSEFIKPLNLNVQERKDLINFLHTLTDTSFISDKRYSQN